MKLLRTAASAIALAAWVLPAAATDVGVSISISQPGVYGRIDIGNYPRPSVWVPQPVIIGRPVVVAPEPVYMWVPPGHRKDWKKYCGKYNACGVPVYFVRDDWYEGNVMKDKRRGGRGDDDHPGKGRGNGHGNGKGNGNGKDRD